MKKPLSKQLLILATLLSIFGVAFLVLSDQALAFELFPGETAGASDFRIYITNFYKFSIGASILVATVMIMIGGVIWITSAGDQGRVGKAREFITNSIIGVVLLMGAYVILALINPNLVELKPIKFEGLGVYGKCESINAAKQNECEITSKSACKEKTDSNFTEGSTQCNPAELCTNKSRTFSEAFTIGVAKSTCNQLCVDVKTCTPSFDAATRKCTCVQGSGDALVISPEEKKQAVDQAQKIGKIHDEDPLIAQRVNCTAGSGVTLNLTTIEQGLRKNPLAPDSIDPENTNCNIYCINLGEDVCVMDTTVCSDQSNLITFCPTYTCTCKSVN